MARNLKLEVTNYSRSLYGLRRASYPSSGGGDDDDDDDDDYGDEEDSEATLSYQPRKRQQLLAIKTHRNTTNIFLSFIAFIYLFIFLLADI